MKILSLNAGSSTLKFKLYEMPEEKTLISGTFERIGDKESFYTLKINGEKNVKEKYLKNHSEAIQTLLDEIIENNILSTLDELDAVGNRMVAHYDEKESIILNSEILKELEIQEMSAPLHLTGGIASVKGFMELLPSTKVVGCFDSAFHNTIGRNKYLYGVPYNWFKEYGIRKYGYHGFSYKYVCEKMKKELNNDKCNLIICHIGQGASICAIKEGKSFDTSMGFSTNSGVIMGTRSGDIDYGIIKYMSKVSGKSFEELDDELYNNSGLYGLSNELSSDWRDIDKEISKGNLQAKIAHYVFVNSIFDYVSKYYLELGNVDAICFTAGIGENSPHIRRMVIDKLSCLDLKIDRDLNDEIKNGNGKEGKISSEDSSIPIYVIPTDEEIIIARNTYELVKR